MKFKFPRLSFRYMNSLNFGRRQVFEKLFQNLFEEDTLFVGTVASVRFTRVLWFIRKKVNTMHAAMSENKYVLGMCV